LLEKGVRIIAPGGWTRQGGIESYARAVVLWLRARRPDLSVDLVDSRGEGGPVTWPLRLLPAMARLTLDGLRGRAAVAHINMSERSSVVRKGAMVLAARLGGLRVVLHHHGADLIPWYEGAPGFMRLVTRWAVRGADENVVLGRMWRDWLIGTLGAGPDRVRVLYNGVADLSDAPTPLSEAHEPFRPILLAVLSDRKGVGEYLQALAALKAEGLPIAATCAGGGPELERFRRMARALGLSAVCDFPGWVAADDVPAALSAHHAYVLPSHREGLPIGILEAMRAARPVVATDVGSIAEAIPPDSGVTLVPPGDVAALTAALRRLAGDPALRRAEGRAARERYLASFSLDAHMAQLLDIYTARDGALAAAAEGA